MKPPVYLAMMRIKNEARWIEPVLKSLSPLCRTIFVLDDHSTDATPDIVAARPDTVLFRSSFEGLNESRDKNWLLEQIMRVLPKEELNTESPYWVLCIDGDEELEPLGAEKVRRTVEQDPRALSFSYKILYLWDSPETVRVDGVYGMFKRPSMFRLVNPTFKFQDTPWGGNLHCSSIPQEFLGHAKEADVTLLHYGYMHQADRVRKWEWYNTVDPNNEMEDRYRHMIQGDPGGPGVDEKLKWAGPLKIGRLLKQECGVAG